MENIRNKIIYFFTFAYYVQQACNEYNRLESTVGLSPLIIIGWEIVICW